MTNYILGILTVIIIAIVWFAIGILLGKSVSEPHNENIK